MGREGICIDDGSCDILSHRWIFQEYLNPESMNDSQIDMVKKTIGAGGAVAIAPLAAPVVGPVLSGVAGIAILGLGAFAVGSLVGKVAGFITNGPDSSAAPGSRAEE